MRTQTLLLAMAPIVGCGASAVPAQESTSEEPVLTVTPAAAAESSLERQTPEAEPSLVHYRVHNDLYVVGLDGSGPRRIAEGVTSASISLDRSQVAFVAEGLWVANADGSDRRRIVEVTSSYCPPLSVFGWSPDHRIAFHVTEPYPDDELPDCELPDHLYLGYTLIDPTSGDEDGVAEDFDQLLGFAADPLFSLCAEEIDGFDVVVEEPLVDEGRLDLMYTAADDRDINQVNARGNMMVYVALGGGSSTSRVEVIQLGEEEPPRVLTPLGSYAEYQWPRLSPSRAHVAFRHQPSARNYEIQIVATDGGDVQTVYPCPDNVCRHRWYDARSLLITGTSGLMHVDIESGDMSMIVEGSDITLVHSPI